MVQLQSTKSMVNLEHHFQTKEGLRVIIFIPRAKEEGHVMGVVLSLSLPVMAFHFNDRNINKAKNMKLCNVHLSNYQA